MEAAKRPVTENIFVLKDSSPAKPNRWLALPRAAFDGATPLTRMTAGDWLELWTKAMAQGKEMWGDGWGIALNSDISRTQCHMHAHIGKLLKGQEPEDQNTLPLETPKRAAGVYINGPAELPTLADGAGMWFHPAGNRLHVHTGELITETVLLK